MIAPGASHNSAERHDPPKCHPKTREAVLKKIMDWVQGLEDSERRCYFMWLYGPAGAGKSAIAQTIAELCYELGFLAASFFLSRTSASRSDHSRLIATLTYQLCLSIPEIRSYVEDVVDLDRNIFGLSIETQLRKLIIEPLSHLHDNLIQRHGRIRPMLIIIDGLDQCASSVSVQRSVLRILAEKLPIPMLFLVASRPEPHIRGFFTAEPMASITTSLALDDSYQPDDDIKVFLEAKFDVIKKVHPLKHQLPESWPPPVDIDHLVRKSSGQFIYASTIMKYIESPRHWPTDRLGIILGIMKSGGDTPFAALDELYTDVFSSVGETNAVLEVLSVLVLVQTRYILKSPALIEDLLGLRRDELKITLIDLHSILDVPFEGDAGEVRVLYTSLAEFLLDQTRSGNYHIDQGCAHANLARHLMRCTCQKSTSFQTLPRSEISKLRDISSAIFILHCTRSYPTAELLDALWSLDLSPFWTLYYQPFMCELNNKSSSDYHLPYASRASRLSDFFTWLKNNGSSKEGQDLYSHVMRSWDRYIRLSLAQLPASLGPLESQCIIFYILPQFHRNYKARHVFPWGTVGADYRSLLDLSFALEVHDGDCRYDLSLVEFFSDPSRSGPFYLDSNKYTSFATTFTRYLIKRTISECDLSCLATLLSKASYSIELAILLNSKLKEIHSPDLVQKAAGIVNLYRNSSESSSHSCYGALHAKDSDNSNSISDDRLVVSREESTAPSSKFSPAPRIGETNEGRHTASTLENVTIHTTQETPIFETYTVRLKRTRESPEENGDASPSKRPFRQNWNIAALTPQNVTPTLPQPNIPALAANNLVKVPPWRAPPNDYAGPTNTVLLPTIDPTVTETVPTTLLTAPQNVTPTLAQPNIPALAANNLVKVPPWRRAPPNDYAGPTNTVLLPTIDPTVTETVPTTLLTAPQNVTPTLPQPNIPALAANNLVKVPPWRRAPPNDYAGPTNTVLLPTIDPTVTETVPTTLLTPHEHGPAPYHSPNSH
ncbi:hypothetical protein BYT27DRAFT_7218575 [Phlegmacium glaucopus]|nr:hypothetical protein BYT27DRAFT_7218575 [Phlegmacium glaucopus]